ncbi:MAG: hypothetical protein JOZ55_11340, partial [Alphaproteobacteria bacterium]|nr:hypothetical protein [Alphaproteobacteria bacterium]
MLSEVDRIQIAVTDAGEAARLWQERVGAEIVSHDRISCLAARRTTLRAGASDIELLEPDGTGTVGDELKRRGRAHLFAAGASAPDPRRAAERAKERGAAHLEEGGQHHLCITLEDAPVRFVISKNAVREPVGDLDFLYEVTLLAADQANAVSRIVDLFGLESSRFAEITSETFG